MRKHNKEMKEKCAKLQEKMKMLGEINSTLKTAEMERNTLQEKLYKLIGETTPKEKEIKELKRKTVDDFYEEVANIKLQNIELIDQVEHITIEKKTIQDELEITKAIEQVLEEKILKLENMIESNESAYRKFIQSLQDNTFEVEKQYIAKIQQLEKVLKMKTD